MRKLTILLLLAISACSEPAEVVSESEIKAYAAVYRSAAVTPDVQEKWARTCALCHVNGQGGAPRLSDREEWQARLKKGSEVLMVSTVHGLNRMPPMGYCQDCELSDFAAMIKMMTGDDP